MRVLVVSTPVFRTIAGTSGGIAGYGGLESLAYQIAVGLAAKGHKVALAAPDGSTAHNVEVLSIGPERQVDERMAFQRYQQHLNRFDCVVDHSWQKYCLLAKGQGILNIPVLSVCHAPLLGMYSTMPPNVDKPCFVCISEDQGRHFEALHSRPCRVARNGIDLDTYKPISLPRNGRFLFLARFSSVKGPDLAIEACRQACVGLDIVGDQQITGEPQYLEQCKHAAATCNAANPGQMQLFPGVPRGETVFWYSQAHAFVHLNQRFREPLGLAPLEAEACGLPVIAWDFGALRETVCHGETGWLATNMAEAVEGVRYFSTGITDAVRARCREWASGFSLQGMINRYHELCEEAVAGGW